MPEMIDRQALIKDMCNNKTDAECPCYSNCYPCDFSEARRIIDIQPTIEAIPVIYGVILETTDINGKPFKYCSNCKYPLPESNVMNYCNCCGSDFRSPDSFPFSKELAEGIADIVCETVEEQLKKRGGADNG